MPQKRWTWQLCKGCHISLLSILCSPQWLFNSLLLRKWLEWKQTCGLYYQSLQLSTIERSEFQEPALWYCCETDIPHQNVVCILTLPYQLQVLTNVHGKSTEDRPGNRPPLTHAKTRVEFLVSGFFHLRNKAANGSVSFLWHSSFRKIDRQIHKQITHSLWYHLSPKPSTLSFLMLCVFVGLTLLPLYCSG